MTKRKATITILELPERSQKLSMDDVLKIYGGCVQLLDECSDACDCCQVSNAVMSCVHNYYTRKNVCFAN
jgi:hypothetical protein